MLVVPEPELNSAAVIDLIGQVPDIALGDPDDPTRMVCGECGRTLAEGVPLRSLVGMLFRCPEAACRAYNRALG